MQKPKASLPLDGSISIGVVILAAGLSQRMGGVDKNFALLRGKPLLFHSLEVFQACSSIQQIVVVLGKSNLDRGKTLLEAGGYPKNVSVCPGGPRRQDSARCGLAALRDCHWVVIHDAARPCLDLDLLKRGIAHALEHGNAVAAVPVTDTIKVVDAQGYVVHTPPRQELWAVQTPQIFPFDQLRKAYEDGQEEATDDATLVERLGGKVKLYPGSHDNIKVATIQDLTLAEMILARNNTS